MPPGVKEIPSKATIARFGWPPSSNLAHHLRTLVESGVLEKGKDGCRFNNPFFKHWVNLTLNGDP